MVNFLSFRLKLNNIRNLITQLVEQMKRRNKKGRRGTILSPIFFVRKDIVGSFNSSKGFSQLETLKHRFGNCIAVLFFCKWIKYSWLNVWPTSSTVISLNMGFRLNVFPSCHVLEFLCSELSTCYLQDNMIFLEKVVFYFIYLF